jgi:hypothetical protein
MHEGRRPKSLEGGTAGEFAPAVVSVYGDLAPVRALIFRFRTGMTGETLVDNPAGLAAVEAIGVLGWRPDEIRMLSVGCSSVPLDVPDAAGWATMSAGLISLFSEGQSSGALGTAKILLGHSDTRQRLFRIDPVVAAGTFSLDNASKLRHLIGVGHIAARDFLATFRAMFLGEKREAFEPCHR